jgi:hypothetical protein
MIQKMLTICVPFVAIALLASGIAVGQSQSIKRSEFERLWKRAIEAIWSGPVRVKSKTELRTNGNLTGSELVEVETDGIARSRTVFIAISGPKQVQTETIDTNGAEYVRVDSGMWSKYVGPNDGKVHSIDSLNPFDSSLSYAYTRELTLLDGQPATLISREGKGVINEFRNTEIDRAWISLDGRLLKTEAIRSEDSPILWTRSVQTIYDHQPENMNIEIPVIP